MSEVDTRAIHSLTLGSFELSGLIEPTTNKVLHESQASSIQSLSRQPRIQVCHESVRLYVSTYNQSPGQSLPLKHSQNQLDPVATELPPPEWSSVIDSISVPAGLQVHVDGLITELNDAVRRQVFTIPPQYFPFRQRTLCIALTFFRKQATTARLGVLFSGGIDSAVIALLASR